MRKPERSWGTRGSGYGKIAKLKELQSRSTKALHCPQEHVYLRTGLPVPSGLKVLQVPQDFLERETLTFSKGDYTEILGKETENFFIINRKAEGKVDTLNDILRNFNLGWW